SVVVGRLVRDATGERREERQGSETREIAVPIERPAAASVAIRRERRRDDGVSGGKQLEQVDQLVPKFRPRDDPVDEAMREQKLGTLEPIWQLLRDRPGRDPRAGETDE